MQGGGEEQDLRNPADVILERILTKRIVNNEILTFFHLIGFPSFVTIHVLFFGLFVNALRML